MIENLKKELVKFSDESYQKFSSSLLPNIKNVLGVRLPILRKIANKIYKENYKQFFKENDNQYMELTLLEGIIIGKLNFKEQSLYLDNFIEKIDNWEVCDIFCNDLKTFRNNKEEVKKIIEKYLNSNDEFKLRFVYVILLNYFIDDDLEYVLNKINNQKNDKYYAKMALSWCLSMCFIKKYDKTLKNFKSLNLSNWVKRKSLTKAIESLKLTKKQKEELKFERNKII